MGQNGLGIVRNRGGSIGGIGGSCSGCIPGNHHYTGLYY